MGKNADTEDNENIERVAECHLEGFMEVFQRGLQRMSEDFEEDLRNIAEGPATPETVRDDGSERGYETETEEMEAESESKSEIERIISTSIYFLENNRNKIENTKGIDYSSAFLVGLNLKGFDFTGSSFIGTNLSNCDLRHTILFGVDFSNANLMGSRLSQIDLSKTTLSGTNFSGANLYGAIFNGINPAGSIFACANLEEAKFVGVDLRDINFRKTHLAKTDFRGANLAGADFLNATGKPIISEGTNLLGARNIPLTDDFKELREQQQRQQEQQKQQGRQVIGKYTEDIIKELSNRENKKPRIGR